MERTASIFFAIIFSLLVIGFLAIYSSGFALSVGVNSDSMIVYHSIFMLIGIFVFYITSKIDYHIYRKFAVIMFLVSIVLLIAVFVPGLGRELYGAKRWLKVGGSFAFQPTELAKIVAVIFLAHSLAKNQDKLSYFWRGFVCTSAVMGIVIVLIAAEPDLGNAVLLTSVVICMLLIGGFRLTYFGFLLFALAIGIILMLSKFEHIMKRVNGFLHPEELKTSSGYQAYMAITSIGSGGATGVGLGEGQIKLHYLPFVNNDFIASLIGEEAGLLGFGLLLLLFSALMFYGLKIALNAKELYGTLVAFGLVFMVGLQAIFHIGVNLSLFPTKGISLPFISFGGTSLIVLMSAMGIVYNIAIQGKPKKELHELGAKDVPFRVVTQRKASPLR